MSEATIHSPGSQKANTRQALLVGGWPLGHKQEAEQNKYISMDISESNQNEVLWQYHMHDVQMQMRTLERS